MAKTTSAPPTTSTTIPVITIQAKKTSTHTRNTKAIMTAPSPSGTRTGTRKRQARISRIISPALLFCGLCGPAADISGPFQRPCDPGPWDPKPPEFPGPKPEGPGPYAPQPLIPGPGPPYPFVPGPGPPCLPIPGPAVPFSCVPEQAPFPKPFFSSDSAPFLSASVFSVHPLTGTGSLFSPSSIRKPSSVNSPKSSPS